jgi:hypothetical protein
MVYPTHENGEINSEPTRPNVLILFNENLCWWAKYRLPAMNKRLINVPGRAEPKRAVKD